MKTLKLVAAVTALSCASATAWAQTKAETPRRALPTAAAAGATAPRLVVQIGQKSIDSSAFSADGSLVATGSWEEGTVVVWQVSSGREVRRFTGIDEPSGAQDGITAVAFSPDERRLAASVNGVVRVFDVLDGRLLRTFRTPGGLFVIGLAFADGGRSLAVVVEGSTVTYDAATGVPKSRAKNGVSSWARLRTSTPDGRTTIAVLGVEPGSEGEERTVVLDATGKELRAGPNMGDRALSVSPDGRLAVSGGFDTAVLWDTSTFEEVRTFPVLDFEAHVEATSFTPDGLFTASASGSHVFLRDVAAGTRVEVDAGADKTPRAVAFSRDRRYLAFDDESAVVVVDLATNARVATLRAETTEAVYRIAFSPGGRFVAANLGDLKAYAWDLASGKQVAAIQVESSGDPTIAFTPDDALAYCEWTVYDTATWQKRGALPVGEGDALPDLPPVAISPDGKTLVTGRPGRFGNVPQLWSIDGAQLRALPAHVGGVSAVAFSPDGRRVITGGVDGIARVSDVATGREVCRLSTGLWVTDADFSPDGRFGLARCGDTVARLFDATTGREVCRVATLDSGDWVAVDPVGRFDTNAPDSIDGLHWIAPESPFDPLPVEAFMREYFEPRLVARVLAGEPFAAVRSVADLNVVQPSVTIASVASGEPGLATVVVDVARGRGTRVRGGVATPAETGAFDLRLFRDGQLVATAPEAGGEVSLDASGRARLTFEKVKLPTGAREVVFSAYAFNVDRVKSETARATLTLDAPLPAARGRAYVVSVGVNVADDPRLALRFAANDARKLSTSLADDLTKSGTYAEVVPVLLTSEEAAEGAAATRTATKANLRAALARLAGRAVEPGALAGVANADKLAEAGPDDLVVLSFSGHGYAAPNGAFYLVPADASASGVSAAGDGSKLLVQEEGAPTGLAEMLPRCVSNDELALWLRDVDAGQIALVVDACQSAATVASDGFKPGPMGSRGLGQLAYDKGMRVLAATQSDNVALENARLEQGLLTYALAHDGLGARRADFEPADRTIVLSEWLAYGVRRVPELYREIRAGSVTAYGSDKPRILVHGEPPKHDPVRKTQQPALFDFSKRRDAVVAR